MTDEPKPLPDGLVAELKHLYYLVTKGPVHQVGCRIEGGTDDEPRHLARCSWEGEASFYVALRNAFPALIESLSRQPDSGAVALLREVRGQIDLLGHRGQESGCGFCDTIKRIDAILAGKGEK